MNTSKPYIIIGSSGSGPALRVSVTESASGVIPEPTFQPGRLPLRVAADPFRGYLVPGLPESTLFIPLLSLDGHAFWCAGKIRLAPAKPDGRPPHKCLPLVVCYEHAHREPPQIDEVDRVINFLEVETLPCEANAFQVHAAILRAAAREYFEGW